MSHPMWVRGLKLVSSIVALAISSSHPMWVRGLKQCAMCHIIYQTAVAPYVGAWIETKRDVELEMLDRRTLCGCVD